MLYFLTAILVFIGIKYRKSKYPKYALLVLMFILAGFNTWNADREAFEHIYNSIFDYTEFAQEFGYIFTNWIFASLGLSFQVFLKIYFFMGILLIFRVVKKYSNYPSLVLSLYLFFPFLMDVVQLRNFMVMAIMINAFPLLTKKKPKNLFGFLFLCLIATSFHSVAIFYTIFLIIPFISVSKLLKIILPFTAMLTVILATFMDNLISLSVEILPLSLAESIYSYTRFGMHFARGHVIMLGYYLLLILFTYMYFVRSKKSVSNLRMDTTFSEVVLKISVLVFITFPMVLFTMDFFRIVQNVLLLNYMLITNDLKKWDNDSIMNLPIFERYLKRLQIPLFKKRNLPINLVIQVILLLMFLIPMYFLYFAGLSTLWGNANINTVFRAIFENNSLFPL